MPKSKEPKTIEFAKVKSELNSKINLWLGMEHKKDLERKQCPELSPSSDRLWYAMTQYHSMAQVLYLSGKNLGITFDAEIEAEFAEKEGK